jgi:hypothetical protein
MGDQTSSARSVSREELLDRVDIPVKSADRINRTRRGWRTQRFFRFPAAANETAVEHSTRPGLAHVRLKKVKTTMISRGPAPPKTEKWRRRGNEPRSADQLQIISYPCVMSYGFG